MTCPACGSNSFSSLHRDVRDFEHGLAVTVNFDVCSSCGWLVQVPAPTQESLNAAYPSDYRPYVSGRPASGMAGLLRRLKDVQASILAAKILPFLPVDLNTPLLDLGCGSGHLLHALQTKGYKSLTGIDQNPALAAAFEGKGIRYQSCDLSRAADLGGRYGAIIMVNVIEHFLQPDEILSLCRQSLLPNGKVLVITPSAQGLSHLFFGKYWSGLHAPRHTQVFNPRNFRLLASGAGLGSVLTKPLSDPGSWAVSFQNRTQSFFNSEGRASEGTSWYSLALLPLWYPLAVFEGLLGRASSFLAVLSPS